MILFLKSLKTKLLFSFKLGALIVFTMNLTGCWYYSTKPGTIPPHIKNIAVPLIENETPEFSLNDDLTSLVITTILTENLLPLVDENVAQSVLYATIKSLTDKPYTFDETETVKEYKVSLSLEYKWYDTANQVDVMSGTLSQWAVYYSDNYNSQLSPDDQIVREAAILDVSEKIAEDVIFQLVSDW